jgi:RNase P/RNase MRP subunit p29
MAETKIVYLEKRKNDKTGEIEEFERALRGEIIKETDDFITIKRSDGEFTISKKVITRIEKPSAKDNIANFDGEYYR